MKREDKTNSADTISKDEGDVRVYLHGFIHTHMQRELLQRKFSIKHMIDITGERERGREGERERGDRWIDYDFFK